MVVVHSLFQECALKRCASSVSLDSGWRGTGRPPTAAWPAWFTAQLTGDTCVFVQFASGLVLLMLFLNLAHVAEAFLTPTMERVSSSLCMPPRLAGVTLVRNMSASGFVPQWHASGCVVVIVMRHSLMHTCKGAPIRGCRMSVPCGVQLAWANGAPDVSADVAAMRAKRVNMALGSALGAGMFVTCLVGPQLTRLCNGIQVRGAMVCPSRLPQKCFACACQSSLACFRHTAVRTLSPLLQVHITAALGPHPAIQLAYAGEGHSGVHAVCCFHAVCATLWWHLSRVCSAVILRLRLLCACCCHVRSASSWVAGGGTAQVCQPSAGPGQLEAPQGAVLQLCAPCQHMPPLMERRPAQQRSSAPAAAPGA